MTKWYCAQLEKTDPLPPYVINSCGNWATSGSKLFIIINCIDAACRVVAGYSLNGWARIS